MAEPAGGRAGAAAQDGKIGAARRRHRLRAGEQQGEVQPVAQPLGRGDRRLVAAEHQGHAAALQRHQRHRRQRDGGGGEERGHLRPGRRRLARPAGLLADIDEGEGQRGAGRLGLLGEERRLLGAGDGEGAALAQRRQEAVELAAAKLLGGAEFGAGTAARQGAAIERHRVLATADQADACVLLAHPRVIPGWAGLPMVHR
ncbi:hypothetical protein [Siccirubricoccus sp. G192]|uniref:hypothetical protein n=1 Tax=Siccirubricoccus sp. G192 TaxID=2849651 RepID=UPI0020C508B1|nr:hypothetical protein [Siccirubricoccus sp. G192]